MASTVLGDVNFQSESFKMTMAGTFTQQNALLQSGVLMEVPDSVVNADETGYTVAMPMWDTLSGASDQITSSSSTTVNNLGDVKDIAVWVEREKAWGADQMLAVVAGRDKDVTAEVARQLGTYWANDLHLTAIKVLLGAFATALASTHAYTAGSSGNITPEKIVAAKKLLGDNANFLRSIIMNSKPYYDAVMDKIVTYDRADPNTLESGDLGRILGMFPYVTDQLAAVSSVYPSYLATAGSMVYKFGNRRKNTFTNANLFDISYGSLKVQIELNREAKSAGGQDEIITRARYLVHIPGVQWNGTVPSNPTNTQLATGANWTKVYNDDKLIRIVELQTK